MDILVKTKTAEYKVSFTRADRESIEPAFETEKREKCLILTDKTVFALFEDRINEAASCFKSPYIYKILPGDRSKSFGNLEKIINFLGKNNFSKKDVVLAFGGGVVSDIAGLAAALYKRGIKYYSVPTTLLSMVDASVGGKTAINTDFCKNGVGIVYQPAGVIIDTSFVSDITKDINDGFAEAVKCALISGGKLWKNVNAENINLDEIVYECIKLKAEIVEQDENDENIRHILNLGHTLGHGLELASNFRLSHGEAVSIGLSVMCPFADDTLKKLGLKTSEYLKTRKKLLDKALILIDEDKKAIGNGKIDCVICDRPGDAKTVTMTTEDFRRLVYERCV